MKLLEILVRYKSSLDQSSVTPEPASEASLSFSCSTAETMIEFQGLKKFNETCLAELLSQITNE